MLTPAAPAPPIVSLLLDDSVAAAVSRIAGLPDPKSESTAPPTSNHHRRSLEAPQPVIVAVKAHPAPRTRVATLCAAASQPSPSVLPLVIRRLLPSQSSEQRQQRSSSRHPSQVNDHSTNAASNHTHPCATAPSTPVSRERHRRLALWAGDNPLPARAPTTTPLLFSGGVPWTQRCFSLPPSPPLPPKQTRIR